ncbi:CPBP family intramembrane glutamic endopeptidase [Butyrivibrio fibrisolvens]|nr:CPBP family intramembrane glutamic endopeptidase [Butyrivibrio fibrisolvens]
MKKNEDGNFVLSGREHGGYRWFKPLQVILFTAAFYAVLLGAVLVMTILAGLMSGVSPGEILSGNSRGYDNVDMYTPVGAIMNIGSIAVLLPALFFATLVVRYRSFGTYQSVTGKWRMRHFLIYFVTGLIVVALPLAICSFIKGEATGEIHFTIAGFIICMVLGFCQCMAEEHIFRGLLMQTFGGWTRITTVAIILQAVPFAIIHPYNITGKISVLLSGILMGVMVYISGGLEASCAYHILNNVTLYIINGFGIQTVSTNLNISDLVFDVLVQGAFIVLIVFLTGKIGEKRK